VASRRLSRVFMEESFDYTKKRLGLRTVSGLGEAGRADIRRSLLTMELRTFYCAPCD
jgi:hypothetical protein